MLKLLNENFQYYYLLTRVNIYFVLSLSTNKKAKRSKSLSLPQ